MMRCLKSAVLGCTSGLGGCPLRVVGDIGAAVVEVGGTGRVPAHRHAQ